jgi:hypothetical protein
VLAAPAKKQRQNQTKCPVVDRAVLIRAPLLRNGSADKEVIRAYIRNQELADQQLE